MSLLSNRLVSNNHIRNRYRHFVNLNDKKYPFTEEENKKLMMLVEKLGMN